jgi:hypothetical protein
LPPQEFWFLGAQQRSFQDLLPLALAMTPSSQQQMFVVEELLAREIAASSMQQPALESLALLPQVLKR